MSPNLSHLAVLVSIGQDVEAVCRNGQELRVVLHQQSNHLFKTTCTQERERERERKEEREGGGGRNMGRTLHEAYDQHYSVDWPIS